jgi:hypothetical protein
MPLNGVNAYSPEELGAVVDEDGRVIDYQPEAKRVQVPNNAPPAPEPAPHDERMKVLHGIGDELKSKGFEYAMDRQTIALNIAGVGSVHDGDMAIWQSVLEQVKEASAVDLQSLLDPETDAPPPVTNDEMDNVGHSLDNIQVPAADTKPAAGTWVMPDFRKLGTSSAINPKMTTYAAGLYKYLGLATKKQIAVWNKSQIDKEAAETYDEMLFLCTALTEEANSKAESEKNNG